MPDLGQYPLIEVFRQRFDRLSQHIGGHITLVFPFDLPMPDGVLQSHLDSCSSGMEPFQVGLLPPHRSHDEHLWLPVSDSGSLQELTRRLYSGPLSILIGAHRPGNHHLTIARPPLPPRTEYDMLESSLGFPMILNIFAITLESIQPDETSQVLGHFQLRP